MSGDEDATRLPSERLNALFQAAWGPSLEALCAAPPPLLGLADADVSALLDGGLRLDDAVAIVQAELVRWLQSRNQFLVLDRAGEQELADGLRRTLAPVFAGGGLAPALARHRAELADFVRARLGPHPRDTVCASYSPELQLAVLGLADSALMEPVLDVGCGPDAALVRHLRARGVDAHGLDRTAPAELASSGDWLQFAYGNGRWGTVLSHLGFSLHFLHHHLAERDSALDYARAYMAILRSLRGGGRFAYAPGLPFIEALLDPRAHRVRHLPFAPALRVPSLLEIEERTGLSLSHASHIERIG